MGKLPIRLFVAATPALGLALAACQTAPAPAPFVVAGPRHAPSVAQVSNRLVLKLYAGSPAGLVVGGGPADENPGLQLTDLSFAESSGLPNTYVWAFAPGVALLDRDCHPITPAAATRAANLPGANSAIVIDYVGADGRPVASAKVQIWARSSGAVADCEGKARS